MLFFEPKNSFNPFGLLLRGDLGLQKKQFVNLPQNVCFMKKFRKELANRIDTYLLENGYERNDHVGKHEKGSEKRTYRPVGSGIYGNLEIVVGGDGSTYSSYNYGNNRLSHFLIDYLGWKGRD